MLNGLGIEQTAKPLHWDDCQEGRKFRGPILQLKLPRNEKKPAQGPARYLFIVHRRPRKPPVWSTPRSPLRLNSVLHPGQRDDEKRRQKHPEQCVDPDQCRVKRPHSEACDQRAYWSAETVFHNGSCVLTCGNPNCRTARAPHGYSVH